MQYTGDQVGDRPKQEGRTEVCFIHRSSPCALSQTQLGGGPLATFIMQSRDKPLQILAMLSGVIGTTVVVTVTISTATFLRNKRSNRVLPHRRVRRRPRKASQGWASTWTLPRPFGRGWGRGQGLRGGGVKLSVLLLHLGRGHRGRRGHRVLKAPWGEGAGSGDK